MLKVWHIHLFRAFAFGERCDHIVNVIAQLVQFWLGEDPTELEVTVPIVKATCSSVTVVSVFQWLSVFVEVILYLQLSESRISTDLRITRILGRIRSYPHIAQQLIF